MSNGRILALDVGERRIGVAMSDELGIIASPLTTLSAEPREKALEEILALVQQHEVMDVVVGLPLTLSGDAGMQAQSVQSFAAELEQTLGKPIRFFDERLTSVMAEQIMQDDMGMFQPSKKSSIGKKASKSKRSNKNSSKSSSKSSVDEVAASIILQNYLDSMRQKESVSDVIDEG